MLNDDPGKRAGIARLTSDLRSAKVELLSAQCAADRLQFQMKFEDACQCAAQFDEAGVKPGETAQHVKLRIRERR